jgi:hypothetical protein
MEQSTLKRAATTAEVQDPALSTSNPSTIAWEQQGVSKRPRLDEYRESTQESDDDEDDTDSKESSRSIANPRTASDNDGSWSFSDSGLSGTEDLRRGRKERRWIVRKDSANPSVSSVITEVSDSEITSTILGQDDDTCERHKIHRKASQSIESVIRNMESWSVTHIRALRRNNVYENKPGTGANYRTAVNNAKRDVMRTLRRSSDDNLLRSSSRGNLKDDASYSCSNDGAIAPDRSPSPMDEL